MTVISVAYATPRSGIDGFVDAWTALGGTVEIVQPTAVDDASRRWCGAYGAAPAATAECAVVRATAAIAQTGSVVVDTATGGERGRSLLPPKVAFVIDAATIVDTPSGVLRNRQRWWPDGLPSQIVFVTGPSRSADIEMTLTIGVHGPGTVHAIIVQE